MQALNRLFVSGLSALVLLALSGCDGGGSGNGDNNNSVTIQGVVEDGTPTSPIADAICQFVDQNGVRRATTAANANGVFSIGVAPETQGSIQCYPPGLPNLKLMTVVNTMGAIAGDILPIDGREEISPRITMIANIIAQESPAPSDLQARKTELLAELERPDPELVMLAQAATDLFNAMRDQNQDSSDFGVDTEDGGEGDDVGGAEGGGGDGGDLSALANAQCEFTTDFNGDSALEDLWSDGRLDRQSLQAIAPDVQQDPAIGTAFHRFFPNGMQPLINGRPVRTTTDTSGHYFLPIPVSTQGFINCADARTGLSVSTFVRARQVDEIITDQTVSPAFQVFAESIVPQLNQVGIAPEPVEANFISDIGNLQRAVEGIVNIETIETMDTPTGKLVADTNEDGTSCNILEDFQSNTSIYPAAVGSSYTAIMLYKSLLIESVNPPAASFSSILNGVLQRTDTSNNANIEILASDLVSGGVTAVRAPVLAELLNTCIESGVEAIRGPALRARMTRAGRLRVRVEDADGTPVPNAQVAVEGNIIAPDPNSSCPVAAARLDNLEADNRIVCTTVEEGDNIGTIVFVLLGTVSLEPVSLTLTTTSQDGMITVQKSAAFAAPATIDESIALVSQ